MYGSDQEGNSLLIKLTKRGEGNTEIWLILRLRNGSVYTLPGMVSKCPHTMFLDWLGIPFQIIRTRKAFRRLHYSRPKVYESKISFTSNHLELHLTACYDQVSDENGLLTTTMMNCDSLNSTLCARETIDSSTLPLHKSIFPLCCSWSASTPPYHYPNDWSLNLRSTSLATEPWRSGDWLNYL